MSSQTSVLLLISNVPQKEHKGIAPGDPQKGRDAPAAIRKKVRARRFIRVESEGYVAREAG